MFTVLYETVHNQDKWSHSELDGTLCSTNIVQYRSTQRWVSECVAVRSIRYFTELVLTALKSVYNATDRHGIG